ncbi:MAG: TRL-like family protein [Deltaproteobacteria bacterium]|nr:TRL-like family protein [Deltaproteobacteria bacterium]
MFAILAAGFLLTGCLYSNVVAPLSTDLNKTILGKKEGRASTHSVLWLVSWGDAGVAAAAKNGGLVTVNHMDVEIQNFLFGLYTKETTIVYGD